jgi:hypothetical protein
MATQTKLGGKPTDTDESNLVRFEKVQGRLPFTRSSLLHASLVQCAQSCYFLATPHTILLETFFILINILQVMPEICAQMYIGVHENYILLSDFN